MVKKGVIVVGVMEKMLEKNDNLKKHVQSDQYQMSVAMLRIRLKLSMNQKQIADAISISHKRYIELESGNTDIPIEEYNKYYLKMKEILEMYIINENLREALNSKSFEKSSKVILAKSYEVYKKTARRARAYDNFKNSAHKSLEFEAILR